MQKEETLKDFLNTLKISFKNASMYGIEHPAFSESVGKLNNKINGLFRFLIPISLGFTSNSLFVDGRYWEKLQLYKEIASTFHFRKLKSIEIVEHSTNPVEFVKNVLAPARVRGVKIVEREGKKIALIDVEKQDRGIAVGRGGKKIQCAKKLVLRHHGIQDISFG